MHKSMVRYIYLSSFTPSFVAPSETLCTSVRLSLTEVDEAQQHSGLHAVQCRKQAAITNKGK